MRLAAAAALLAALSLSACGGGGGGYDSTRGMADALGCSDSYEDQPGAVSPADSTAVCEFQGQRVTLLLGSPDAVDAAVKVAKGFGTDVAAVKGDGWGVLAENANVAKAAESALKD